MKVKSDFVLRVIAGNAVVVPVGDATVDFNGIINLNETGAFLWKSLQKDISREELIENMLTEYSVDKETAEKDIDIFITKLKKAKLLEEN